MRTEPAKKLMLLAVGFLFAVGLACERSSGPQTETGPSGPEPVAGSAGKKTDAVPLTIANWEQTQQLVSAHRGKVVVLDLWASW